MTALRFWHIDAAGVAGGAHPITEPDGPQGGPQVIGASLGGKGGRTVSIRYSMVLVVVIVCAPFVRAQGGDERVRQDIIATDDRREAALKQGDVATLRQIYADDYTLVSPTGVVQTKSDQFDDLSSGKLHYNKLELVERTVRIYGDTAVMLTRERADIVRNGEQVGGDVRITRVYKRFGARWMVIATHASAIRQ